MPDTFLDAYIEHNKNFESPTSFWKWSAFAAIAGALRDNCFWRVGDDRTYPNIYVLLLANSGADRKGKPVRLANKLVDNLQATKTISGRTSVQAIFEEMMTSETDPVTGRMSKGGAAMLFAEELAAGIVADEQGVAILTDIYDYKLNFKINLVSRGRRKIEGMVFSLLAGSNEDLLKSVYNSSAIGGGLLARTFLIVPDEFRPRNSLRNVVNTDDGYNCLLKKLQQISNLKGEFQFTEEFWDEYDAWYVPFGNSLRGVIDKTGVRARIHTGIMKIAMILAANDLTLSVTAKHCDLAIEACIKLLPNYTNFTLSSGKSDIASAGALLIADLKDAPNYTMTRKVLMRKHWQDFNSEILDSLVTALETAELLVQGVNDKREQTFTLTQKMLDTIKGAGT